MNLVAAPVLDHAAVDAMPWVPLAGLGHARHKVLWRSGESLAGVMQVDPGAEIPEHSHHGAHHHMWVLDGTCTVLGRTVDAGSYAHIPGHLDHGVAAGPDGCTFFYLYLEES